MKNKLNLIILFIFFSFCLIIFYKGLDNSNIYAPKIDEKKKIPIFKAKVLESNIYINSEKIFDQNEIDIVINLAAQAGVRYSLINPQKYISTNILGFTNILEESKRNNTGFDPKH